MPPFDAEYASHPDSVMNARNDAIVDDGADGVALGHVSRERLTAQEHTAQLGADHAIELRDRQREEVAELVDGALHPAGDIVGVADVGLFEQRLGVALLEVGKRLGACLLVQVAEGDGVALLGEVLRGGAADALARPGNGENVHPLLGRAPL